MSGSSKQKYRMELGGGAQFWGHLCPQTETLKFLKTWEVTIKQKDGDWFGIINSDDPKKVLQTPNLSGTFEVTVKASGENSVPCHRVHLRDRLPPQLCRHGWDCGFR